MTERTGATTGVEEEATILVVDDERGLADLYTIWLRDRYEVRTAYEGADALGALDADVDVVLLDRQMPDVTGDELLETVRERDVDCRVAMVTAVEPRLDIVDMGFDDYLRKPVDRETLRDSVERLLRRSAYDTAAQQYFAVARKRALLVESDRGDVADAPEFQRLESELAKLRDRLNGVLAEFDDADYEVLFKRLSSPDRGTNDS